MDDLQHADIRMHMSNISLQSFIVFIDFLGFNFQNVSGLSSFI